MQLAKAGGHKYMDVGSWEPSPDHTILGYSVRAALNILYT
jgi:protease II